MNNPLLHFSFLLLKLHLSITNYSIFLSHGHECQLMLRVSVFLNRNQLTILSHASIRHTSWLIMLVANCHVPTLRFEVQIPKVTRRSVWARPWCFQASQHDIRSLARSAESAHFHSFVSWDQLETLVVWDLTGQVVVARTWRSGSHRVFKSGWGRERGSFRVSRVKYWRFKMIFTDRWRWRISRPYLEPTYLSKTLAQVCHSF